MKKQVGFTLIELIIVIVILGILAAYAVPKYMSVDKEARIAVINGLKGSMLAASDITSAMGAAKGTVSGGCGTSGATKYVETGRGKVCVSVENYPYPDSLGILEALADISGFNCTSASDVTTCQKRNAPLPAKCQARYYFVDENGAVASPNSSGTYPRVQLGEGVGTTDLGAKTLEEQDASLREGC